MQEVYDFYQGFLGLVLAGYVGEGYAGFVFGHDFRAGFAEAHGVGPGHAAPLLHLRKEYPAQHAEQQNGHDPGENKAQKGRILGGNGGSKLYARVFQPLTEVVIRENTGFAGDLPSVFPLGHEDDLFAVLFQGHFLDLARVDHLQKIAVIHVFHLPLQQRREHQRVQKQQHQSRQQRVIDQRLFAGLIGFYHAMHLDSINLLPLSATSIAQFIPKTNSRICGFF